MLDIVWFMTQYVSSTGKIPEEAKALSLLAPVPPVPSLIPGGGLLPIPTPSPLQNLNLPLVNRISAGLSPTSSVIAQPPLMGNVDPSKIDEIRRTVYVGNLNSQTTTADQLLEFFKQVGDVKFVRMAGDETQPTRFAFVEFVEQDSVARALTFNGVMFGDRPLKVNHSNNAIVKPPELTPQAAAKELESVMKRVREAQVTIAAAIEPEAKTHSSGRCPRMRRSRSRSHSHSRSHRKRSRSKHRRSSQRSWQGGDTHSSRSGHRRRSRSKDKRHARSRSRGHKRRSKERSRSPRRKPRSPSPKRGKREKRRERSRDRKERSTSRKRSRRDGDRMKNRPKTAKVEENYSRAKKAYVSDREDSPSHSEDMTPPPCVQHNGSYKTRSEDGSK
ncbi:splicing regulatory glutamine/lysine-rich protein 1 isoform X3 [Oryzias latipes]|uniref:splicing regulatory glutamine/lysine-rich protein 1 isoform X3 n=1 Tax=Oryzias latipes TaxID=8090 RepID=UPI0009D97A60|nr:splicing regulatory glutamine/lysine-rich protein 1 isoform X3 [Oryzias latipes]XP_020563153.1 splicing regulatory glutamine/lysine-rich protein 1 isoform X3 [Oryzias latipes]